MATGNKSSPKAKKRGNMGDSVYTTEQKNSVSPLEAFRENANQLNQAIKDARANKASILEYQDITGEVHHRYWNGATYTDRKSSLYEKEFKGTYKAKFKEPKAWKQK